MANGSGESFKTLAQGYVPTSGSAAIYTVPSGTEAIIKEMKVASLGASATFSLGINGSADMNLIQKNTQVAASAYGNEPIFTLGAGDTIHAFCDQASGMSFLIGGVELTTA